LRGSHNRKHARLRHRLLQAERLEDRQLLATITGTVFNDLNANGLKDGGESIQSGWTVYLDDDGNGQLGAGETSTTTNGNGNYSLDNLGAGTYTVAEVQQLGWQQTSPVGSVPSIERVSVDDNGAQGNGSSEYSSLSADGRYVVFYSYASNLVTGDTNGVSDVFVTANPFAPVPGSHVVALADDTIVSGINFGKASLAPKFYVVNDASLDRTYEYSAAATRTSGSQAPAVSFALAAGNTNPQGIANPPAPGSLLVAETPVLSEPVSAAAVLRGNDAALASMCYEPLKKVRVDTVRRNESRKVESSTRDLSYTVGAAPNYLADDNHRASDNDSQSDVDDLFAEWDSDPPALLSFPDLGI
jgi:hypothetical protein